MKAMFAALALLLLAGCTMKQQIMVNPNGSGTADIQVTLGTLVVHYMDDILGSLGAGGGTSGPPLFDLGQIRSAFDELPGVKLTELSAPTRSSLRLGLSFSDINSVFPASKSGGASPLQFTDRSGVKTLRFLLSQATWPAVAALPPLQNDPLLASLGPQAGQPSTEADYLNLMEYAFADYATKEKVKEAITQAEVDITVTVKGTITAHTGGVVENKSSISFRVPLIKLVTLARPIELSVSFR